MKKVLLAGLLAAGFCTTAAVAKDVKLPADKPAASVTLPDEWSVTGTNDATVAKSPDGTAYIAFKVADTSERKTLVQDSIDALAKDGVELDTDTQKKSDGVVNNMKALNTEYEGKDKSGPMKASFTVIYLPSDKILLMTLSGNAAGLSKNGDALTAVLKSVKPEG